MRVLIDSTTPLQSIPDTAEMVGTYCNGRFAIPLHVVKARWPKAKHVRINIDADPNLGDCLDIETGDATPNHLDEWAKARLAGGVPPENLAVYCNRATLPAVQQATKLHLFHWVATLDGNLVIAGYRPLHSPAAVQAINANMAGANVDISLVFEDGWHPIS
jgi:hypothetical protein